MAFTSHGHHIEGTVLGNFMPSNIARCGGPGLCGPCSREANNFRPALYERFKEMDNQERAKLLVAQYFNKNAEKTDQTMISSTDDVYVVWFCYILGGWKALISTTVVDGMYYEVTYNKEKSETYLDAYKKWDNVCVPDGEQLHSFETKGEFLR